MEDEIMVINLSKTQPVIPDSSISVPDAPTSLSGAPGDLTAAISFVAPSNNGGSTILGYTVTSSPGNIKKSGTSSPITVTGLTNGTPYTFTVKANNITGSSAESSPSNSVTPSPPYTIDLLIIAGGGAGESNVTAGGGAGGVVYRSNEIIQGGNAYTVTVGAGAPGGNGAGFVQGQSSQFASLTAAVGGGTSGIWTNGAGGTGGSGGGGAGRTGTGGLGTAGQGNNGGNGFNINGNNGTSGGGGGAGSAGSNGNSGAGGAGGNGTNTYSSWASATSSGVDGYYAGGGGGGGFNGTQNTSSGGLGGGGTGKCADAANGVTASRGGSGAANTGSGAGGGGSSGGQSGNGGSGIIILRTAGSVTAASTLGSPTRYEAGGYTYYKFTETGSITL
jgi:hypothetical protein